MAGWPRSRTDRLPRSASQTGLLLGWPALRPSPCEDGALGLSGGAPGPLTALPPPPRPAAPLAHNDTWETEAGLTTRGYWWWGMGGGGGAIHLPVCSGPRAPGPPSSPGRYNGPPPSGPARTRAQEGKSPDYGATASWQPMSRGQPHLCASTPHPRTSEAEVSLSLGHSGTRGVVLGHTLNTQTLKKSKTSHNGCRKCTIFCSEALIASQGSLRRRPPQPPLHLHPHPPPAVSTPLGQTPVHQWAAT